ncbi:MAG: hypothetical protein RL417_733 [Pseudomonadota bacterium]|jgi:uncharacterized membrane protein
MIPFDEGMWRIELLHPPLVHFPIAFLLLGTGLELLSLVVRQGRRAYLRTTSLLLFTLGVIGAWLAVWSGGEAEHIVNRVLCDPTVTEAHEEWATAVSWIFTGVLVLAALRRRIARPGLVTVIVVLGAIAGSIGLTYVGHLGASLVYQQGAAVRQPSADCREFAE